MVDRDYEADGARKDIVEQHYKLSHINQTYCFVKRIRAEYKKLDKAEMGIWECCELLNEVVDDSDPDLDEPQIQHLLQSAEAIRKDYPNEDWLHLTALIHDIGKILVLPNFGELPQWAVVGDTFPVGCAFDEANVHHKYFKENPDFNSSKYNTKNGVYSEGCGLDNVLMSWGHDDYMYMVAKENGTTLPSAGLFIIRYHSFYPLHKYGAYTQLMNEEDKENIKWLKVFNKYDLYSKSKVLVDVEEVKPYYESLIAKRLLPQIFPSKAEMVKLPKPQHRIAAATAILILEFYNAIRHKHMKFGCESKCMASLVLVLKRVHSCKKEAKPKGNRERNSKAQSSQISKQYQDRGSGHLAPSRSYLEYHLEDFSVWLQRRVRSSYKWERIKVCLSSTEMCAQLNQSYTMAIDFFNAHLTPIESGCCKPPTECRYTFVNPTNWISPINNKAEPDCIQRNSDQTNAKTEDIFRRYKQGKHEAWGQNTEIPVLEFGKQSRVKTNQLIEFAYQLFQFEPLANKSFLDAIFQYGCYMPPAECGYTYLNPTYWLTPNNTAASMDCLQWSNDHIILTHSYIDIEPKGDCFSITRTSRAPARICRVSSPA
ncbi:hypothetical protein CRYUN_Cryun13aG0149000 [Craigia yunnanensis]